MRLWQCLLGLGLLIILIIFSYILVANYQDKIDTNKPVLEKATSQAANESTHKNASQRSTDFSAKSEKLAYNYFVFSQEDYQQALKDERPILLFFYASWCKPCEEQDLSIRDLMNSLGSDELKTALVFRVNFDDEQTDNDEKTLARNYSVNLRDSLLFIDRKGKEQKRIIGPVVSDKITDGLLGIVRE